MLIALNTVLCLCFKNMPSLHAPLEVALSQLKSIERRLMKAPEQVSAYQAEIRRLEGAGYVVRVEQDEVEKSDEEPYIPHHIVRHIGKNRVMYNRFF